MNLRFTNWYTQALGATLGVIACMYSYLNGYMITYSNIDTYFDSLWFGGIVSSYFLLPLCILTLLLAVIKSYDPDKIFLNIPLENFNVGIIVSTVIIGFMGARIYFTIPAIFILFNLITYKKSNEKILPENEDIKYEEIKENFDEKELKTLLIKREMARELLIKNAQKQFIMDITGLTLKELEVLEGEFEK
ncbi:hypothetical protein [Romboutsia sp.]|uniref:hypothetical protein n=1 Tax=Romboutsia sp. TaxID=1965302 RepID=UPI002C4E8EA7|nr:hypothetical protein [Romboutsia sp.]HSQ87498.1 hypothetical protein [Romboutsia sp.]